MTTYTLPAHAMFDHVAHEVACAWGPEGGLAVTDSPQLSDAGRTCRWRITHARSGRSVLTNLDQRTAIAVARKLVELGEWDKSERQIKKDERYRRLAVLAHANPRAFAQNGGGMEKL